MDLAWLQTNWVLATATAGVALLLLIIVIVALAISGRKRKTARIKASAEAPSTGRLAPKPAAAKTAAPAAPAKPAPIGAPNSAEPLFTRMPATAAGPVSAAPVAVAPVSVTSVAVAPSVTAPAVPKEKIVINLGSTKPEDWKTPAGEQASASPSPSGLRLATATAAVSVVSAPARQGQEFVCDFEVRLVAQPANGAPVNFFVGPVMRDAAGKMISYWLEQPSFTPDQTVRKGSVEVTAPEGAATVHVGVHGSWRADGMHGDAPVEFTHLGLRQK